MSVPRPIAAFTQIIGAFHEHLGCRGADSWLWWSAATPQESLLDNEGQAPSSWPVHLGQLPGHAANRAIRSDGFGLIKVCALVMTTFRMAPGRVFDGTGGIGRMSPCLSGAACSGVGSGPGSTPEGRGGAKQCCGVIECA